MVTARKDAVEACRILYGYRKFGWECGDGWNIPLANVSYALEELNLRYFRKYRTKIIAEQVKEKFGTLRFYYTIVTQQPLWRRIPGMALGALLGFIKRKVDFKTKPVTIERSKTVYEYELLPEKEDPAATNAFMRICECENGKRYSVQKYTRGAKTDYVPSRHRFLYAVTAALTRAKAWISSALETAEPTKTQLVISEYMDMEAARLVKRAEDECFCRCEVCGREIGDEWSPRCETPGWITYRCEDCIPEGSRYKKCGKTFVKGKTSSGEAADEDKA